MERYRISTLDVTGYDASVPNSHWTIGSDTLLVMLPGLGYTNQMPLMFYVHELAINRQWDILTIDYDYRDLPESTPFTERLRRMRQDCRATIDAALVAGDYRRVILAGKSLGTAAMTAVLDDPLPLETACLWLTPLPKWEPIAEAMRSTIVSPDRRSCVVIGTRDAHYDEGILGEFRQHGVTTAVMPGGDHGLTLEGDVIGSINALAIIMRSISGWLDDLGASRGRA